MLLSLGGGTQTGKGPIHQVKKETHVTVSEPDTSSVRKNSAVNIYINRSCACGPHLNPEKVRALSSVFGPGQLSRVLRDVVQALIDVSLQPKQMFSILKTRHGDGDVVVRGRLNGKFCNIMSCESFLTQMLT